MRLDLVFYSCYCTIKARRPAVARGLAPRFWKKRDFLGRKRNLISSKASWHSLSFFTICRKYGSLTAN